MKNSTTLAFVDCFRVSQLKLICFYFITLLRYYYCIISYHRSIACDTMITLIIPNKVQSIINIALHTDKDTPHEHHFLLAHSLPISYQCSGLFPILISLAILPSNSFLSQPPLKPLLHSTLPLFPPWNLEDGAFPDESLGQLFAGKFSGRLQLFVPVPRLARDVFLVAQSRGKGWCGWVGGLGYWKTTRNRAKLFIRDFIVIN